MTDLSSTSWWSPCPVVSIDVFAQLIPPRFGLGLFLFLSSLTGRRQRKCTVLKKHAFSPFKTTRSNDGIEMKVGRSKLFRSVLLKPGMSTKPHILWGLQRWSCMYYNTPTSRKKKTKKTMDLRLQMVCSSIKYTVASPETDKHMHIWLEVEPTTIFWLSITISQIRIALRPPMFGRYGFIRGSAVPEN